MTTLLNDAPNRRLTGLEQLFVWLGGTLFVASLLYCAFAFGVDWSRGGEFGRRGAGWRAVAVNTLVFAAFAAHHSAFARGNVKAILARIFPEHLVRSLYVWTASGLFILAIALWQPVGGDLYRATGVRSFLHALVQLSGVWLVARSVGAIDPLELAGIRHGGKRDALQVGGVYRLVRHPLYLGWMLMVFGAAHMTGDRLVFAAITSVYLVVAIPWEERGLERAFGDDYVRYRSRVRWRVIPFVY